MTVARASPHTMQWSHKETHSLIQRHWLWGHKQYLSSSVPNIHGNFIQPEGETDMWKSWDESRVLPRGVKPNSIPAHPAVFHSDKLTLKMETKASKQKKVVSDKPLTHILPGIYSHIYIYIYIYIYISLYLQVGWKLRKLNLEIKKTSSWKRSWWDSPDIPTVAFTYAVREKAGFV